MTAGRFDISCTQGNAFTAEISVKNPDESLPSLFYWSARMQVRRTTLSPDTLIELSTDNGRIVKYVEGAKIVLSLSSEETSSLPVGEHVYDLEVYNTIRNCVLRLIKGKFTVG